MEDCDIRAKLAAAIRERDEARMVGALDLRRANENAIQVLHLRAQFTAALARAERAEGALRELEASAIPVWARDLARATLSPAQPEGEQDLPRGYPHSAFCKAGKGAGECHPNCVEVRATPPPEVKGREES